MCRLILSFTTFCVVEYVLFVDPYSDFLQDELKWKGSHKIVLKIEATYMHLIG